MDAATAQKIVGSLDEELARRRKKRSAEIMAQWWEESDGDPVYFVCKMAEWERANPSPPLPELTYPGEVRQRKEALEQVREIVRITNLMMRSRRHCRWGLRRFAFALLPSWGPDWRGGA
jgi:hypothetical protein